MKKYVASKTRWCSRLYDVWRWKKPWNTNKRKSRSVDIFIPIHSASMRTIYCHVIHKKDFISPALVVCVILFFTYSYLHSMRNIWKSTIIRLGHSFTTWLLTWVIFQWMEKMSYWKANFVIACTLHAIHLLLRFHDCSYVPTWKTWEQRIIQLFTTLLTVLLIYC